MKKYLLQGMLFFIFNNVSSGQIALFGLDVSGGAHSNGQVYQLCEFGGTWVYNNLHDFPAATNAASYQADASLCLASNNVLYSVSYNGGTNWNGEVFSYNPTTLTYTDLFSAASNYDAQTNPVVQLVSGGSLFGMTESGGASFNGTVYKYNYHTNTYTTLHTFAGKPTDGSSPVETPLLWYRDTIYGVTF
ncbi:MAG TPA: choice-of-anchor tandem repeat GloVer-containing protein, partial [Bacteroidia bacterium]|nr:choice-of-anchor tandem repeat GloVer-containing protein [Bacteroidia bacterium]